MKIKIIKLLIFSAVISLVFNLKNNKAKKSTNLKSGSFKSLTNHSKVNFFIKNKKKNKTNFNLMIMLIKNLFDLYVCIYINSKLKFSLWPIKKLQTVLTHLIQIQ